MFGNMLQFSDDNYLIDEPSDDDDNDLSSEEEDVMDTLKNVLEMKKCPKDEFEQEMNTELNNTMKVLEVVNCLSADAQIPCSSGESLLPPDEQEKKPEFYDDIYFDSDDSDSDNNQPQESGNESKPKKAKRKHKVLTNEELLYDPNMDDDDQNWIDDQRRQYQPHKANSTSNASKKQKLPSSDAVLNCPACMTTLCRDCQRHEVYSTQYRAMFVQNCTVNFTQQLRYPTKSQKKQSKKKVQFSDNPTFEGSDPDDLYNPVNCTVCNTEVAVFDKDELYHFFNVLSSY